MAEELSSSRLNINQTINIEEMTFYSNSVHTRLFKQGYGSSAKALQDAVKNPLKLKEAIAAEPYALEKTWDYSEFSQIDTSDLSEEQREKHRAALIENNEKLLAVFKKYLVKKKLR